MILTAGELKERLNSIEKCNLCSEQTTLEDAQRFCYQVMKVVSECGVKEYDGAKVFHKYLSDCFDEFGKIPAKFVAEQEDSMGFQSTSSGLDYALSILANLSSGSALGYGYAIDHFQELNKNWINAHEYFLLNAEMEQKGYDLSENPQITDAKTLSNRLNTIPKCNLCSEETELEEAEQFCRDFMAVLSNCKVPSTPGAQIVKDYLEGCFVSYNAVPDKLFQHKGRQFEEVAQIKSPDYAIAIIGNLISGDTEKYEYALSDKFSSLTKNWLNTQLQSEKAVQQEFDLNFE